MAESAPSAAQLVHVRRDHSVFIAEAPGATNLEATAQPRRLAASAGRA
jgi:hypothetical protein